jgi:hypothetical protein
MNDVGARAGGISGGAMPVAASVEIGEDELVLLRDFPERAKSIEDLLSGLGFSQVHIDPRGYRQGGADAALVLASGKASESLAEPEHG